MATRVLVLSAGTGATNNLVRGTRAGGAAHAHVGCHDERFTLKKSGADRNYLVPPASDGGFLQPLLAVVAKESIDLVLPGNDDDVRALAAARAALGERLFLPADDVIATCQDKYRLSTALRARGVPAPRTAVVTDLAAIEAIFADFGRPRLWCRIRNGSGSRGAIPVIRPAQARAWIEYWHEMRGVPVDAFTLSEYLPGRDFAAQALWRGGEVVLDKICERLAGFRGGRPPTALSPP